MNKYFTAVELSDVLMKQQPSLAFMALRESGILQTFLPEVDCLWGVPQRAEYHPEVDTGVHLMMVMDMAARLNASLPVRFACLVHDLGKGTTPAHVLPRHLGHEERSAQLLVGVGERFGVPEDIMALADVVAREHGNIHRSEELTDSATRRLLQRCDAFEQPERFNEVLLACECDARGRLGFEETAYPQAERLKQFLKDALQVKQVPSEIVALDNLKNRMVRELCTELYTSAQVKAMKRDVKGIIPREELPPNRVYMVGMWYTVGTVTSRFYYYTDVYGAFCDTINKLPGVAAVPSSSSLGRYVAPRPGLETGFIETIADFERIYESDSTYIESIDKLVDVLAHASTLTLVIT